MINEYIYTPTVLHILAEKYLGLALSPTPYLSCGYDNLYVG